MSPIPVAHSFYISPSWGALSPRDVNQGLCRKLKRSCEARGTPIPDISYLTGGDNAPDLRHYERADSCFLERILCSGKPNVWRKSGNKISGVHFAGESESKSQQGDSQFEGSGRAEFPVTGYRLPESNLPREGAMVRWREIRGLEKGWQKHEKRKE